MPASQLDLTGNGVINIADAWQVARDWTTLQDQGSCFAPGLTRSDVDSSGCVDIADVQKVLSHLSEGTSAAAAPQGVGLAAAGTTYTVNTTLDGSDTSPGDGECEMATGGCSLKAAVQETNAHPGRDTIKFDVRNPDGTCPITPSIFSPKPIISKNLTTTLTLDDRDNAGTVVDGYSQCGASPNTEKISGNAVIRVELKGSYQVGIYGLTINSANNEVRGLAIYNWDANLVVTDSARDNVIAGNFLGTNAANTFSVTYRGKAIQGNAINVRYYATNTIVGGTDPASRNIISGSGGDGFASDETMIGAKIWNNYIGLKQDGITQLANNSDGFDLDWGSAHNYIGGTEPGQGNVIAGNKDDGIELSHIRVGKVSEDNHVLGNIIGLNALGGPVINATTLLPNKWGNGSTGVTMEDHQQTTEVAYNYLANNGHDGVRIYFHGVGCSIHDNMIGLSPSGKVYPNGANAKPAENYNPDGIWLIGDAQHTLIARNTITGSVGNGILISNRNEGFTDGKYHGVDATDFNTITQNSIYGNNGVGIKFEAHDGDAPNENIKSPVITDASTTAATGSTKCANCTVEFFIADQTSLSSAENAGEGKTYIGSGTTDANGVFLIAFSKSVNKNVLITATVTDGNGNTSVFSKNVAIGDSILVPPTPEPTEMPTITPTYEPTTTIPPDETSPAQPGVTPTDTNNVPGEVTATPSSVPTEPTPGIDPAAGQYKSFIPVVIN